MARAPSDSTDNIPKVDPPSIGSRIRQAVDYVIGGVTPSTWFSPMQPLRPMAPEETKGRVWDFPIAWNLNYIPRTWEPVSFAQLQQFAQNEPILRLVIETRKDQIEALQWEFQPKVAPDKRRVARKQMSGKIEALTEFWQSPDRNHDWSQWIRGILEQHFVYDAVAIHKRRTRGGQLYSLNQLDAAQITVLMDAHGKTPEPPSPAYQQILKGIPAADYTAYTTGDLLYSVKNFRPDHMYGYSPVEQIVAYVEIAIARVREQLAYYTHGDVPRGVMEAPASLTTQQIQDTQTYWDSIFKGNIEERARLWWVPAGSKYTEFKKEVLFDQFDEWLARVICYAFSIAPQPFIKQVNRATAQTSQQEAAAQGLQPTMRYIERLVNKINREELGITDLVFAWQEDREFDPTKAATIDNIYVRAAITSIDEVRDDLGLDPIGGAAAEPMFATANGYVPLDNYQQEQEQAQQTQQQQHEQAMAGIQANAQALRLGGPPGAAGSAPGAAQAAPGRPGSMPPQRQLAGPGKAAPGAGKAAPGSGAGPRMAGVKPGSDDKQAGNDGAAVDKSKSSAMTKLMLSQPGLIVRPLLNAYDLKSWGASVGIPVGDDLHVVISPFVGGLFVPFDMDDELQILPVSDGIRSLAYTDQGLTLVFDCATLQARAAQLGSLQSSSGLSLVLNDNPLSMLDADDPLSSVSEIEQIPAYPGVLVFGPEVALRDHDGLAKVTMADIEAAVAAVHPNPTLPQAEAGNYRMGHIVWNGLDITIENAKGSVRQGADWQTTMAAHYGYIRGTSGADGDQVDVFIGPSPESNTVYVLDQVDRLGHFDEHKCFIGYNTWVDAVQDYMNSYTFANGGRMNVGIPQSLTVEQFKNWLAHGDLTKPLSMNKTEIIADRPFVRPTGNATKAFNPDDLHKDFNVDEPRDDHGKWTDGGAGGNDKKVLLRRLQAAGIRTDRALSQDGADKARQGYSVKEQFSIQAYTSTEGPIKINGTLRGVYTPQTDPQRQAIERDIANLDSAFAKESSVLPEDARVYRGLVLNEDAISAAIGAFRDGHEVTLSDKGFSSTTFSKKNALEYASSQPWHFPVPSAYPVIVEALVRKGSRGIMPDAMGLSVNPSSTRELILPRDGRFRIIDFDGKTARFKAVWEPKS